MNHLDIDQHIKALADRAKAEPHMAQNILKALAPLLEELGLDPQEMAGNTMTKDKPYPGHLAIEQKIENIIRWNAVMMVLHANQKEDLGGHLSTYASAASLYEVGFNHFFRTNADNTGDILLAQGHASPGIYSRAYLEERLTEEQLNHFRREVDGKGLSSYPHPFLMRHFWQIPTVSMGLGMLHAIYQARFQKYLEARALLPTTQRKIWFFCGDGEMNSIDASGALAVASHEHCDNLVVVVNCNLQGLDSLICGNDQIMKRLARLFRGAGWRVIQVVWGNKWDQFLAQDKEGHLERWRDQLIDGEYQLLLTKPIPGKKAYILTKYPLLEPFFSTLTDLELHELLCDVGGHSYQKIYTAYAHATHQQSKPTVILARSIKGYLLGGHIAGHNIAHQTKKMPLEILKQFSAALGLPFQASSTESFPYYLPSPEESAYLKERRKALGGFLPKRNPICKEKLTTPSLEELPPFIQSITGHTVSTTVVFVRLLKQLLRRKDIGERIIPIIADEGRTFGFEGLFREIGVYTPQSLAYEPADLKQLLRYKEIPNGVILQEGINEAGAMASWTAAATAYSYHQKVFIPFYIYYAMFGMQRVGDVIWSAADMCARGFIMGGLSGRTTPSGEGLQHQDGHNPLFFSAIPTCCVYTPTFGYELAVIIQSGMKRMVEEEENTFFYIDVVNESYAQPAFKPEWTESIQKGMYLIQEPEEKQEYYVQLLGTGTILHEVIKASDLLKKYHIGAYVWSVTSFSELRKASLILDRENALQQKQEEHYITSALSRYPADIIVATTDYIRLFAEQIRAWVPKTSQYVTLGTDGFGRSDTRQKLRQFFEVNQAYVVYYVTWMLYQHKAIPEHIFNQIVQELHIDKEKLNPLKA